MSLSRLKTSFTFGTIACAAMIMVAGCTGGAESNAPESTSPSKPADSSKKLLVGMVFDSGGRGDKSFNDSAYAGLERAQKELGVDIKIMDSKSEKDYEGNIATMSEAGANVVFAVGFSQAQALSAVAPKHPDINYAIVDAGVELKNARSLLFSEEQGSYLAGYLAALVSKTGKIGFVGGKKIPLIEKFEAGFKAGAMKANPAVVMLPSKYTESWDDTQLGKESAKVLFAGGADIVYHAAGRCGVGVINAAKETGKFAIGVDSNQDDLAPGFVLTSMIKRVDEAVFQTIKDAKEGKFTAGAKIYDLKSNGVGLSDMKNTKDKIGDEILKKVEAVKQELVEGKITAPSKF